MEESNIHYLSLFMDSPIYLVEEEREILLQSALSLQNTEEKFTAEKEEDLNQVEDARQELSFEGGFEKGVLVAYDTLQLSDELKELLFKILDAVGCSLKDIALCHAGIMQEASMEQIEALNPAKIIVFGRFNHPLMHHKKEAYTVQMSEDTEYLFADTLEQINHDKSLKKALWLALKTLFNVTK
ncbi:hypothetical protein [Cecembia sp.]|uniref:hypothetical protein n=1 Tax=Cecembia sp. TaxID=1898110 RepID=UPI0025BF0A64|nr:hypothetical protein [Cecembia sp.]